MSAMLVSAICQSVYPGYFIFWKIGTLITQIYVQVYKKIAPLFVKDMDSYTMPFWLHVVANYVCRFCVSFFGVHFLLCSWEESVLFGKHYKWIGHYIAVFLFIVTAFLPSKSSSSSKRKSIKHQ